EDRPGSLVARALQEGGRVDDVGEKDRRDRPAGRLGHGARSSSRASGGSTGLGGRGDTAGATERSIRIEPVTRAGAPPAVVRDRSTLARSRQGRSGPLRLRAVVRRPSGP